MCITYTSVTVQLLQKIKIVIIRIKSTQSFGQVLKKWRSLFRSADPRLRDVCSDQQKALFPVLQLGQAKPSWEQEAWQPHSAPSAICQLQWCSHTDSHWSCLGKRESDAFSPTLITTWSTGTWWLTLSNMLIFAFSYSHLQDIIKETDKEHINWLLSKLETLQLCK